MNVKIWGKVHPFSAFSLLNIAICHISLGNYQKALDFCEQSKLITLKIQGINSINYV